MTTTTVPKTQRPTEEELVAHVTVTRQRMTARFEDRFEALLAKLDEMLEAQNAAS